MTCDRCKRMIVAHAFSFGKCKLCGSDITTPHMPCYDICDVCSDKHNKCVQCGEKIIEKDVVS